MSGNCRDGCTCGGSCGCCAGTAALTPETVWNRPGLDALAYRAGTHASFLETMEARLSSADFPELSHLRTRATDDPALALLDGWATVADVLTFYQERLANEGYLRTATERRSVQELARLIGYEPRPGVAASVHLAFELEAGSAVTIPAGSRVQSTPGPGELPQTFETSEPLAARDVWNNLQARLTRPQVLTARKLIAGGWIYFQGISTNLRVNDPLLLDFSAGFGTSQGLYRVRAVEMEPLLNRTRVEVEPWNPPPAADKSAHVQAEAVLAVLRQVQHPDNVVSPNSQTTKRVLGLLASLQGKLEADEAAGLAALAQETLPQLQAELTAAQEGGFKKIAPWIEDVRTRLLLAQETQPEGEAAPGPTPVADLSGVLASLAKAPSIPPRSRQQLALAPEQAFAEKSDVFPRLVAAGRPELRQNLYQAWRNVPVTPAPAVRVYALRTRAAVFGHNAPLAPVRNADGVVIGSREWDLGQSGETALAVQISRIDQPASLSLKISIGGAELEKTGLAIENSSLTIDFPQAGETIVLESKADPFRVSLAFQRHKVVIALEGAGQTLQAFSAGIDPEALLSSQVNDRVFLYIVRGKIKGEVLEESDVVHLDTVYPQILPESWIVLDRPNALGAVPDLVLARAQEVRDISRAAYGLSGKETRVKLDRDWLVLAGNKTDDFAVIRETSVYAQSELLELAEEPLDPLADAVCGDAIELQNLYDGLQAGRWVIVSGERTDLKAAATVRGPETSTPAGAETSALPEAVPVPGVHAEELAMLAGVEQVFDPAVPGDRVHSRLLLANPLAYCYKLDTVTIYGNVVRATHGETRVEVLGAGDASRPRQRFTLRQSPLTFVPAATPSGIASTLEVRVNEVLWHEAPSIALLGPADRSYTTRTEGDGKTSVVFGDGQRGARLPTGPDNVAARYRIGIGKGGNVPAERINLLASRPLGVKGVINPLPATGGADPESRDQARRNAPLAVLALDRLVSVTDYADFARTFAGIGKASAVHLSDGRREIVHLTIAGEADIPIAPTSDLYQNLEEALYRFGDPRVPVRIELRDLSFLVVIGGVRVLPDYAWDNVEPKIRQALGDTFAFDRRDLGQDVTLSEVIGAIQRVPGVDYVDLDALAALPASTDPNDFPELLKTFDSDQPRERIIAELARRDPAGGAIVPAQLIVLNPDVPETLLLKELAS